MLLKSNKFNNVVKYYYETIMGVSSVVEQQK